jgi:nicotinamide mononucleotide transporter PnuC
VEKNDEQIKWIKPYLPILSSVILAVLIYSFNAHLSQNPILDSMGTAVSIVAAYLLVKQDVNAWFLYLLSDIIYIYLGISSGDLEYSVIYGVMMLLAIYGTKKFIKKYKEHEK